MDRFTMRLRLGYVDRDDEVAILTDRTRGDPLDAVEPCAGPADVARLREAAARVRVAEELKHYIVAVVAATRGREGVRIGASPRASLAVLKAAQAMALFDGLDYVTPEHVQEVAEAVVAHRLVLEPEARYGGLDEREITAAILAEIPAPG
jgi:MoxR-like ATPase